MRATTTWRSSLGLALVGLLGSTALAAQTSPALTHVGHVADGFRGTPEGKGLLPTAVAEADIALQHATLAGRDVSNLDAMKRHMGHVLHAIDPTLAESGPGLGYGVKAAATGAAQHIELAAGAEGASDAVKTHAAHIATASRSALAHAEQAVALAKQIQSATDATAAAATLTELTTHLQAVVSGTDTNGDGRIGWQAGEGGLAQATQHMGFLKGA